MKQGRRTRSRKIKGGKRKIEFGAISREAHPPLGVPDENQRKRTSKKREKQEQRETEEFLRTTKDPGEATPCLCLS